MTAGAREKLRTRLRDLAAAAAFGAMAVSGSMPPWAVAIFLLSLVLGLAGYRLLSHQTGWALFGLSVAGVLLFGAALRGYLDLVVAACTFASLITSYRMLSLPGRAAESQVLLTGLLMVAGGAALSGELLFAPFLAAFALLSSLTLALRSLEGTSEEGDFIPVRAALQQASLCAGLALVIGGLFFLAFPRLSWNLAARRAAPGLGGATTGFSEKIRLGGGGTLKTNPRVVARVKLSPDPMQERLEAYWFGRAFDLFDGREWRGAGEERPSRSSVTLRPHSGALLSQQVELLPAYQARTALALDPPVMLSNAVGYTQAGSLRVPLIEVEQEEVRFAEPALGYSYHAYSLLDPEEDQAPPPSIERYLGLPARLDPRVPELARRVAGSEAEPLAAAEKLAAHLRREYRYSLELPGEEEDPLAAFLFQRREGHCEHFATALAVMLRTLGHPARVAGGFFGGERVGDQYLLRAGDAHAWTQVHVPGRGFLSVDATPGDHRGAQPRVLWEWLTLKYEQLDLRWRSWVLDYTFRDQLKLARTLVNPPQSVRPGQSLPPVSPYLVAMGVGVAVYLGWRAAARRRARPKRHRATGFLEAIERTLRRAGFRPREGETIEELAARVSRARHPVAAELRRITSRYLEARFGARPLSGEEREELLRALEQALSAPRRAA